MTIKNIVEAGKEMASFELEINIKELAEKLNENGFNWCETPSNQGTWYDSLKELKNEGFTILK